MELQGAQGHPGSARGTQGKGQGRSNQGSLGAPWLSPGSPWAPLASKNKHRQKHCFFTLGSIHNHSWEPWGALGTSWDLPGALRCRQSPPGSGPKRKKNIVFSMFFWGGQWHPGRARGPREKPGGRQGALGTPSLAFPWGSLALPGCPWPPKKHRKNNVFSFLSSSCVLQEIKSN